MVAAIEWTLVFRIYLATIPALFLILFFIPSDKKVNTAVKIGPVEANEKMPWLKLLLLDGAFFIYGAIYCIVYYQIAMVATEKALGDVSFIGVLSALGTVGSLILCFGFGFYYNKLKRFTPFVGFSGLVLGFLLLYIAETPVIAAIGNTLLGGMYGLGLSYYMTTCTLIVPPSQIPMAVSITSVVIGVSSFLSTYLSLLLQSIMGLSIIGIIPPLMIVLAIGAALSLIAAMKSRKIPQEAAV
jgi:hypothetical protein